MGFLGCAVVESTNAVAKTTANAPVYAAFAIMCRFLYDVGREALPILVDHVGFDAFLAPLALGENSQGQIVILISCYS